MRSDLSIFHVANLSSFKVAMKFGNRRNTRMTFFAPPCQEPIFGHPLTVDAHAVSPSRRRRRRSSSSTPPPVAAPPPPPEPFSRHDCWRAIARRTPANAQSRQRKATGAVAATLYYVCSMLPLLRTTCCEVFCSAQRTSGGAASAKGPRSAEAPFARRSQPARTGANRRRRRPRRVARSTNSGGGTSPDRAPPPIPCSVRVSPSLRQVVL